MSGKNAPTSADVSLGLLSQLIEPDKLAYFDLSGALPNKAMEVCRIIRGVDNPDMLRTLLAHSKTLHPPRDGRAFPIAMVQRVINERLEKLSVPTSQTG